MYLEKVVLSNDPVHEFTLMLVISYTCIYCTYIYFWSFIILLYNILMLKLCCVVETSSIYILTTAS